MAGKLRGGQTDWEFIRAAQIERRECQREHHCTWVIGLGLDDLRSVVTIRVVAYELDEDGADRQLAAYTTSWPNAQVQTFPAALFQAAVRLTRLVEDCRRTSALISTTR